MLCSSHEDDHFVTWLNCVLLVSSNIDADKYIAVGTNEPFCAPNSEHVHSK